jgi:hypothetical protein
MENEITKLQEIITTDADYFLTEYVVISWCATKWRITLSIWSNWQIYTNQNESKLHEIQLLLAKANYNVKRKLNYLE